MKLYIGDKHLSSWSMRPWLLMKHFEIPFGEVMIRLDRNTTPAEIAKVSPSGRVPVLVDNDILIWDSLAICEYLVEKFPRLPLWPDSTKLRAQARSLCAEMHSSFMSLRKECPMSLVTVHHEEEIEEVSESAKKDLLRIDSIFHSFREVHKLRGPFLFGSFGIVDAYFMPVISRIRSYGLTLQQAGSAEYYNHVISSPLFQMWTEEARKEIV